MADKKKTEKPATPSSSSPSKGSRSSGGQKRAKQNQEARRARKTIRHLEKRNRHGRALRAKGHLNMILRGDKPVDLGRAERRHTHEKILATKEAQRRAREMAKNPGQAQRESSEAS